MSPLPTSRVSLQALQPPRPVASGEPPRPVETSMVQDLVRGDCLETSMVQELMFLRTTMVQDLVRGDCLEATMVKDLVRGDRLETSMGFWGQPSGS